MSEHEHPEDGIHPDENPGHYSDVEFDKEPTPVALPEEVVRPGQPLGLWVLFITEMWERFSYYGMRALLVLYLIASSGELLRPEDLKVESYEALQAEVVDVVAAQTGVPANQISLDSPLRDDLALDASDITALLSTFEEKFDRTYPDDSSSLDNLGTVSDLTRFLASNRNPGFGWEKEDAYLLYGVYTWLVYLTPIFGGLLADKLLGTHRSMLIGGWIIAAGHVTLAVSELVGTGPAEVINLETGPAELLTFVLGLLLIVIGTGFFKPCVSVMVGQLYGENDPRRDSGFTIFYMGINLGAFFSPIVAGTLGETVGWHWGFGAAAVGMVVGIFIYQICRPRYLQGVGLSPKDQLEWNRKNEQTPAGDAIREQADGGWSLSSVEWQRIGVILILAFVGNIFFWTAFEQAGSSMNVFAAENTDRTLSGYHFPATWYQSVNPLAIIVFAPVFSVLWVWLERKNANPSTPMKFCLGLWLLGLSFLAMVAGSLQARGDSLAGPHWLLVTYIVCTWGELCLSPVGLSMVTKLAPARLQSLMMGLWFFSLALSNLFAGMVATLSEKLKEGEMTFVMEGLPGFFLMLVVFPVGAGVLVMLMTPMLKRMMHGRG